MKNLHQGAVTYEIETEIAPVKYVVPKFKHTTSDLRGGIGVALRTAESVESMIKRFKKTVIESKVLDRYHQSQEFIKPSIMKRAKRSTRKYRAINATEKYK